MIKRQDTRPVAGILWMALAGLLFVGVNALVKFMGARLPAPEAAFLRYSMGLVLLLPSVPQLIRAQLSRRQWGLFGLRGLVHTFAVSLWFFAMVRIPLADVTSMGYLSPIYVTLGAALFLGERLAMRRIMAVVLALVGAVIILRPGLREIGPGHYAMLGAALFFAVSYLLAKQVSDEVAPAVVVLMMSLGVTVGLAPMAAAVWIPPTGHEVMLLAGVAVLATVGHYSMTLAFQAAPVTVTQPVTFLQLLWAVMLGALVFNEAVDIWVVVGGLVILGSVMFIMWREAVLKRRNITPVANATKV